MQAAMRFAEEHRDWIEVHYKEAVERQKNRKTYGAEEIRNFTEKLRPVLYYSVPQWGCGKYIMYEPLCWHFKYANGKVSHPIGRLGFY